ncbi:MAG: sulfide/dihydroorotate dehydrogenase-like FAD/NAD-binding protein [Anaerolineales bacterium]|nr:sulfide/dihydroorotate dehydrogenase-like FAD/NAD-binding protein [Anaerolineales bacterium]MDW8161497.1 sulfide/dihydroorotate dehydrogenase-like FAD/NAD-binding protein [Anaerolineales bacterium]
MFEIIENRMLVPNVHEMTVHAPDVAKSALPGQFVIFRSEEEGERIPLSLADWDVESGIITVVYLNVGRSTAKLATLKAGQALPTVVGPLGNPMEIDYYGAVLCVGGCYGIASIYPIARALKEAGNKVVCVLEARSSFLLYWQEKLSAVADRLIYLTRDGSRGKRGHVGNLAEILHALPMRIDRVILNGCNYLMMRGSQETLPLKIKTMVTLNTLMIDGTGMCGVCRVTVNSETKFACVDGPHFDGHQVDWAELTQRRKAYLQEEILALRTTRPL